MRAANCLVPSLALQVGIPEKDKRSPYLFLCLALYMRPFQMGRAGMCNGWERHVQRGQAFIQCRRLIGCSGDRAVAEASLLACGGPLGLQQRRNLFLLPRPWLLTSCSASGCTGNPPQSPVRGCFSGDRGACMRGSILPEFWRHGWKVVLARGPTRFSSNAPQPSWAVPASASGMCRSRSPPGSKKSGSL